ncbi:beta-ketoacyl synthase N-terminal-like domain-containing protein [Haloglycomyces albus]|uniref:beta-ketoacyl synthase N-terminal-like domain-containing protein n=1 Tax=Haloglycomyces albus TaxID=526067 RepID=UPI00046D5B7E|nr:beta-ketoacyl synthase N-terminal-like domain-containing protein [Haloglycomyces albus]
MTSPELSVAVTGLGSALPAGAADDEWFDYRSRLGRRGYKYLPRAAQYLLASTKDALADASVELGEGNGEDFGVAVGTNESVRHLHAGMDSTIRDENAEALSPATAPYFSVNLIASRLGTEHGLRGFNVSVTTPHTAGVEALALGARSLSLGRAERVIVGAVESPVASFGGADDGSVSLVTEAADTTRPRYGTVRAASRFVPDVADDPDSLRRWCHETLSRWTTADDVPIHLVAPNANAGQWAAFTEVGHGCLTAAALIRRNLMSGPTESAVLVVSPYGNLSLAYIQRSDD